MPEMRPRQEIFCQLYSQNANAARAAARAGYAPRAARKQGSRLLADDRVKARVAELRATIAKHNCIDAEQLMAKLEAVFCQSIEACQWGAAVRAIELQAQLAGILPRRAAPPTMGTNADNKRRNNG